MQGQHAAPDAIAVIEDKGLDLHETSGSHAPHREAAGRRARETEPSARERGPLEDLVHLCAQVDAAAPSRRMSHDSVAHEVQHASAHPLA